MQLREAQAWLSNLQEKVPYVFVPEALYLSAVIDETVLTISRARTVLATPHQMATTVATSPLTLSPPIQTSASPRLPVQSQSPSPSAQPSDVSTPRGFVPLSLPESAVATSSSPITHGTPADPARSPMSSASHLSSSLLLWSLSSSQHATTAASRKATIQGILWSANAGFPLIASVFLLLLLSPRSISESLDHCNRLPFIVPESAALQREMQACQWCDRVAAMVQKMKQKKQRGPRITVFHQLLAEARAIAVPPKNPYFVALSDTVAKVEKWLNDASKALNRRHAHAQQQQPKVVEDDDTTEAAQDGNGSTKQTLSELRSLLKVVRSLPVQTDEEIQMQRIISNTFKW